MIDLTIITDSEKARKVMESFFNEQIAELENEDTAKSWEEVLAYRLAKNRLTKMLNYFKVQEPTKPKIPNQYK